jgi:multiple sugar transport system ATP-binding protein
MASVSIDQVRKTYDTTEVIHGVTIDIADGEFVILVGPSGCGKSTLLRMVAGLESISAGEIRIDDKVVNNVRPKDRDIAMVFQSYALYPHMTVAENMGFSLRLRKENRAAITERVTRAAEILGLTDFLDRHPRHLSGGQRQRVAMGRAIVRDPKVFLFDEPLSNLDAKLRVQMRAEIKELQKRLGTTTIYVTHDQIEAMTMADKIVLTNKGFTEQIGSPLELYDRPVNVFVAGFIGSPAMNFLKGKIQKGPANTFQLENGETVGIGDIRSEWHNRPAILGIRPEHLQLVENGEGFRAKVAVTEPTGKETQVVARVAGQEVTAVMEDRREFRSAEEIRLMPKPGRYHLFDVETEKRLELAITP